MEALARSDELRAYINCGFWHTMDALHDRKTYSRATKSAPCPIDPR